MKRHEIIMGIGRVISDFFAVFLAWQLTYAIRPLTDLIPYVHSYFPHGALPEQDFFMKFTFFSGITLILLFAFLGFYKLNRKFDGIRLFFRIILGTFIWGMVIVAYFSLVRHETFFSRVMLAQSIAFSLIFIFIFRLFIEHISIFLWEKGIYRKNVFLLGEANFKNIAPFCFISSIENADEIWCMESSDLQKAKVLAEKNHLIFRFMPSHLSYEGARMDLDIIQGLPILTPLASSLEGWNRVIKRFSDIVLSIIFIILLSPLFLIIALFIRQNVFFVAERIGRKGKPFFMYKFRSMRENSDKEKSELQKMSHRDGPLFKIKNDPRITPFGRFLRRFSLDELPQLFNVFKGDMSLSGPRPHLREEIEKFSLEEKKILKVRPGITGLAQVSGRSDLPFDREIEFDLYFIQNWSLFLEVKILLRTVLVVLWGKGAD